MAEPLLVYSLPRASFSDWMLAMDQVTSQDCLPLPFPDTSQGHWCLSLLPQPWCPLHGSRATGLRNSADCGTRKRQPGPCNNVFSAPERRPETPLCPALTIAHCWNTSTQILVSQWATDFLSEDLPWLPSLTTSQKQLLLTRTELPPGWWFAGW